MEPETTTLALMTKMKKKKNEKKERRKIKDVKILSCFHYTNLLFLTCRSLILVLANSLGKSEKNHQVIEVLVFLLQPKSTTIVLGLTQ